MSADRTDRLTIRGLGVTRAVAGEAPLPAVAEELCSIIRGPIDGLETSPRDCVDGRVGTGAIDGAGYVDAAFTKARLDALLAGRDDFSVLHLGTHFSLRPGNALRSSLLLGDGTRLTLDALSAFDFTRLSLVTLSACQTGLGGASGDDGREVEGLSSLVQRRGAQRVVASLWRVEDASTAALMRELYASIAAGSSAATALQHAARALRADARYRHPYYWAGFVVAGAEP
jgi:CHAT domain-containing protein